MSFRRCWCPVASPGKQCLLVLWCGVSVTRGVEPLRVRHATHRGVPLQGRRGSQRQAVLAEAERSVLQDHTGFLAQSHELRTPHNDILFTLTLTLCSATARSQTGGSVVCSTWATKAAGIGVLVVDGESRGSAKLIDTLGILGFEAREASGGAEAPDVVDDTQAELEETTRSTTTS